MINPYDPPAQKASSLANPELSARWYERLVSLVLGVGVLGAILVMVVGLASEDLQSQDVVVIVLTVAFLATYPVCWGPAAYFFWTGKGRGKRWRLVMTPLAILLVGYLLANYA